MDQNDSKLSKPSERSGCSKNHVRLTKDKKLISRVACLSPPTQVPADLDITSIVREDKINDLAMLPGFYLRPSWEDLHQQKEWATFLGFLQKHKRVAVSKFGSCECYIVPSNGDSKVNLATVRYRGIATNMRPSKTINGEGNPAADISSQSKFLSPEAALSNYDQVLEINSQEQLISEGGDCSCDLTANGISPGSFVEPIRPFERSYATAHPSYLKTLGQAHSSWIFGAIAELVDNARDAKATKLEVAISMVHSKAAGKDIPMLGIIDDGNGMRHEEIRRMVTFGHKQPEAYDVDCIGRYGIGFKTGAMRLGKDALVLTQTATSRSIAFLSQSLNEGKDNVEIPILTYRRIGQYMEVDTDIQNEDAAKYSLRIIKEFSPFDKYLIGEKAGLFSANGTGTQIYVWNLDEWGSSYSLEWEEGMAGGSSFHQGGIYIRSKRIRSRTGQMSSVVPLDYSLRSYLEVIFQHPRMKIYVQGFLVKSRPLENSLNSTVVENGFVLGKPVQLILGRSQLEWEQANCGIFLYWHGRLIEAYKRVGSMIHNGDHGRGILGIIDVTDLMDESNGNVWVHNNKQSFQDCEAYAELEKWLGEKTDGYLDKYVDAIQVSKASARYKPDRDWVQCNKCRKWRMLSAGFEVMKLPVEWFCYMTPFSGKCEMPEEKVSSGVINISTKREMNYSEVPRDAVSQNVTPASGVDSDETTSSENIAQWQRKKRQRKNTARKFIL